MLQVAASLPKTSYFKRIDIWLLFCIFSTFLTIIFHILIDRIEGDSEKYNSQDHSSRNVLQQKIPYKGPHIRVLPVASVGSKDNKHSQTNRRKPRFICSIKTAKEMERYGKIIISCVIVIFNLVYWLDTFKANLTG